jgi:hypothetical protein
VAFYGATAFTVNLECLCERCLILYAIEVVLFIVDEMKTGTLIVWQGTVYACMCLKTVRLVGHIACMISLFGFGNLGKVSVGGIGVSGIHIKNLL